MRLLLFVTLAPLILAGSAAGDDVAARMGAAAEQQRVSVQRAMAQGVERQRESVRKQARTAVEQEAGAEPFFTISWPKAASMVAVDADCEPLAGDQVERLVEENTRNESLSPELLREVMRRESGFRPCAVSRAGAQGLMQLMPATANQFHVSDAFDPGQNVAAGAKFLKSLLTRYGGDVALALGAYNAGPGRVDEAGGVPAIAETKNYVSAILGALTLH